MTTGKRTPISSEQIAIKFKNHLNATDLANFSATYSLTFKKKSRFGIHFFTLNETSDYVNILIALDTDDRLESYFINHLYENPYCYWPYPPTNDSYNIIELNYSADSVYLWPYVDTKLVDAWEYTHGDPKIIIGVLDNGLFLVHEDLNTGHDNYSNIWTNVYEIPNNGIDEDKNEYIDDYNGWNFANNNSDINHSVIDYPHGTWMSSIIASKTNNVIGTFGVAGGWSGEGCNIMTANLGSTIYEYQLSNAIEYLVEMGARVINMSFAIDPSSLIETYINDYYNTGLVTFVAAVGNQNANFIPFPANLENVIGVGGTAREGGGIEARWFALGTPDKGSNMGDELDITAPCVLLRTDEINPNGPSVTYEYRTLSNDGGTSAASAYVSGVIGLMLSVDPCLTNEEIYSFLIQTADKTIGSEYINGHSTSYGYGRISVKDALELCLTYPNQTITTNIVWNNYMRVDGTITIEPGGQLTISGKNAIIKMHNNNKIIVKPGGRLIIDGGTITSSCSEMWEGIEIWGCPWLTQNPTSNQGLVQIINGGTIQNAHCALRIFDPIERATNHKSGGVAMCENANFINNAMSIDAEFYSTNDNISYFKECVFDLNNKYLYWQKQINDNWPDRDYPLAFTEHVRLRDIAGIEFIANTYSSSIYAYSSDFRYFGTGINSINSSFNVISNEDNSLTNVFSGLEYGIQASGVVSNLSFKVERANFASVYTGIYMENILNAKILSNEFNIRPSSTSSWAHNKLATGIYMDACTGYQVINNTFSGTINPSPSVTNNIGIYVKNSGPSSNYIYNNVIQNLTFGSIAEGYNYNGSELEDGTGLCFKCNDFFGNKTDISIVKSFKSVPQGIRTWQGYQDSGNSTAPAGNLFSQSENNICHINNLGDKVINYLYHEFSLGVTLDYLIPDITETINHYLVKLTTYNKITSCPIKYNNDIFSEQKLLADYNENIQSEKQVFETLSELKDGGNTEETLESIETSTPPESIKITEELLNISPYLSDTSIRATVENEAVFNNSLLRDILICNPHAGKSQAIINKIQERLEPMNEEMFNEILIAAENESPYKNLSQSYSKFNTRKFEIFDDLIEYYWNEDNPQNQQKFIAIVNQDSTLYADLNLIKYQVGKGNMEAAMVRSNNLCTRFSSIENINNLQVDIADFISLYSLKNNNIELDSIELNALDSLALFGEYPVNNWASCLSTYIGRVRKVEAYILPSLSELQNSRVKPISVQKTTNDALELFPNPASDYVIVSYNFRDGKSNNKLIIRSLEGKLIKEYYIAGNCNQKTIKINDLPKGLYLIELSSNNSIVTSSKLQVIH